MREGLACRFAAKGSILTTHRGRRYALPPSTMGESFALFLTYYF
jgi:hypothetical protein